MSIVSQVSGFSSLPDVPTCPLDPADALGLLEPWPADDHVDLTPAGLALLATLDAEPAERGAAC